jgi:hypothetical protein
MNYYYEYNEMHVMKRSRVIQNENIKKGNFFVSILILFGLFEKVKDIGIKNILQ